MKNSKSNTEISVAIILLDSTWSTAPLVGWLGDPKEVEYRGVTLQHLSGAESQTFFQNSPFIFSFKTQFVPGFFLSKGKEGISEVFIDGDCC